MSVAAHLITYHNDVLHDGMNVSADHFLMIGMSNMRVPGVVAQIILAPVFFQTFWVFLNLGIY